MANSDPYLPDHRAARRRLARVCRLMSALCLAMIVGVAGYLVLVAILVSAVPQLNRGDVSPEAMLAMGAIWVAGQAALIWGLWNGRRCFGKLAEGRFFDALAIAGLRNFAAGLFLYKASSAGILLAAVAGSYLQGFTLPKGTGVTNLDLGEMLFTLAALGTVAIIATVLAHAADIAEDNAQIV